MKKQSLFISSFLFLLVQTFAQTATFTSDSPRCAGDTMHFTPGTAGVTILKENWDFGDGATATYLPPTVFPVFATHLYTNQGNYTVTRTVTYSGGALYYNTPVHVAPNPVANFYLAGPACELQPVQFIDASLAGGGGVIVSWNWNFGDPVSGASSTSALQDPTHFFYRDWSVFSQVDHRQQLRLQRHHHQTDSRKPASDCKFQHRYGLRRKAYCLY